MTGITREPYTLWSILAPKCCCHSASLGNPRFSSSIPILVDPRIFCWEIIDDNFAKALQFIWDDAHMGIGVQQWSRIDDGASIPPSLESKHNFRHLSQSRVQNINGQISETNPAEILFTIRFIAELTNKSLIELNNAE